MIPRVEICDIKTKLLHGYLPLALKSIYLKLGHKFLLGFHEVAECDIYFFIHIFFHLFPWLFSPSVQLNPCPAEL